MFYIGVAALVLVIEASAVCVIAGAFYAYEKITVKNMRDR